MIGFTRCFSFSEFPQTGQRRRESNNTLRPSTQAKSTGAGSQRYDKEVELIMQGCGCKWTKQAAQAFASVLLDQGWEDAGS